MAPQTRTSNRTQQVSYADAPEPIDYDSYNTQPISPPQTFPQDFTAHPQPFSLKQEAEPETDLSQAPAPTPARRGRKPKSETQGTGTGGRATAKVHMQKMDTGGVEVKTKFPTARIKRIMQADEDVGKVAQVTPVVVGESTRENVECTKSTELTHFL